MIQSLDLAFSILDETVKLILTNGFDASYNTWFDPADRKVVKQVYQNILDNLDSESLLHKPKIWITAEDPVGRCKEKKNVIAYSFLDIYQLAHVPDEKRWWSADEFVINLCTSRFQDRMTLTQYHLNVNCDQFIIPEKGLRMTEYLVGDWAILLHEMV